MILTSSIKDGNEVCMYVCADDNLNLTTSFLKKENLEIPNAATRSRKSKKDRQCNYQMKRNKSI